MRANNDGLIIHREGAERPNRIYTILLQTSGEEAKRRKYDCKEDLQYSPGAMITPALSFVHNLVFDHADGN